MTKDEHFPLGADMNQDISNAILFAHQKMTRLVEDVKIFFSEAKTRLFVDEGLIGALIFILLFLGVIETLWWRNRRSRPSHQEGCDPKDNKARTESVDNSNRRSRGVPEEASDLEEIRSALQNELNQSVERRVEGVRARINSRKEEMQQRLAAAEVSSIFLIPIKNCGSLSKTYFLPRLPWNRSWKWCVPSTRPRRRR